MTALSARLLAREAARKRNAVDAYHEAVLAAASDLSDDPTEDELEAAYEAAGKTVEQFLADVDLCRERLGLAAVYCELSTRQETVSAVDAQIAAELQRFKPLAEEHRQRINQLSEELRSANVSVTAAVGAGQGLQQRSPEWLAEEFKRSDQERTELSRTYQKMCDFAEKNRRNMNSPNLGLGEREMFKKDSERQEKRALEIKPELDAANARCQRLREMLFEVWPLPSAADG